MPELYEFQREGVEFLLNRERACLFYDCGLGKTPVALTAAREKDAATLLIVCPSYAIEVWRSEIDKWFPALASAVVSGPRARREAGWLAWSALRGKTPRALITTYLHLPEVVDVVREWDLVIADECHALTNRRTKAFGAAKRLRSLWLFLLTGTPTRKTPAELFAYLQLIDRKRYSSYWRWLGENFLLDDGRFGKEILGLSNAAGFRESLAPYALRRRKDEVLTQLPPLTRQQVLVEPDGQFAAAYRSLSEELLLELEEGVLAVPNRLALTVRLRQLCVAPSLLGLALPSPAIGAAVEVAEPVLRGGGKVVIFTPFRQALPYLMEAFRPFGAPMYDIHGEQDRETNAAMLAAFQARTSPAVLFSTISMAASWSANSASTCLFVGFSFSPIDHVQSEGRLHRHGQPHPVNAYYVGVRNSIDEHVLSVIEGKVAWERLALEPRKLLKV